jgi:phosphonate transport system substrate-binding protein
MDVNIDYARGMLWVGKEQAKAAEVLRKRVAEVRDRISGQAPRVGAIVRGVEALARDERAAGERAEGLAAEERRAREEVERAMREIRSLGTVLSEIESSARANESTLEGLLASAETVSGLLAGIGRVTRQTQMLALNAAIEAARAGEAGRGFSVVAREVGNLAQATQGIASEIDRAVGELRGRLSGIVEGMEREREGLLRGAEVVGGTVRTVESAGALTLRLGEGLQAVAGQVAEQAAASARIAREAEAVGAETEAALGKVQELDGTLQKEARSAAVLSASLADMSREVLSLQTQVGRLRPPEEFWVGFTPFAAPEHIRRTYGVIARAVASRLGKSCRVFVSADYETLGEQIREGVLDLAWFSPLAYVVAAERVPMRVLAIPRVKGRPSYQGLIITRKGSGIEDLRDLGGRTFAFVDPSSGSGYLYPRVMLQERGYDPDSFFGDVRFLGSHDRVIRAVLEGEVEAGATYTDAWDAAAKTADLSRLVVLARTEEIPKDAVAVRAEAEESLVRAVSEALLSLGPSDAEAAPAMRELAIDGFVPGEDRMYDVLRRAREAEARMKRG